MSGLGRGDWAAPRDRAFSSAVTGPLWEAKVDRGN